MPELTVCMPVYNGGKYIAEAIGSILGQTCRDFVFLLYDDGSTDDSVAIAESFNDDRVRIIHGGENKGGVVARTNLINAIDSEYCMWCDSDDFFHRKTAFQSALRMAKKEDYDLVNFISIRHLYPNGDMMDEKHDKWRDFSYFGDKFFETHYPTEQKYIFNSKIYKSGLMRKCVPEDDILSKRFVVDDMFFVPMAFFQAERYLNSALMPPFYTYREDIGIWGANKCDCSPKRIRDLCYACYHVIPSLYNRMSAVRKMSAGEMDRLIQSVYVTGIAKKIQAARKNYGDEQADSLVEVWKEFFCADDVHLLNGVDGFEMPPYVKMLNTIVGIES